MNTSISVMEEDTYIHAEKKRCSQLSSCWRWFDRIRRCKGYMSSMKKFSDMYHLNSNDNKWYKGLVCCCFASSEFTPQSQWSHQSNICQHNSWHTLTPRSRHFCKCGSSYCVTIKLTHWGRDKMAAIFPTTFSNGFSWMKMYEFRLTFHWSLFLGVQLTIFQHWFR